MIYFQDLSIIPNRNATAIKQELPTSSSPRAWEPLSCILFQGTSYLGRTSCKGDHIILVFWVWSISLSMCSRSLHAKLKHVSACVLFYGWARFHCVLFLKASQEWGWVGRGSAEKAGVETARMKEKGGANEEGLDTGQQYRERRARERGKERRAKTPSFWFRPVGGGGSCE